MKKIFIAGASGFIGKHILEKLIKSNIIYVSRRDYNKIKKDFINFLNFKCIKKKDKKISFDFLINCIANTNTQNNNWEELYKDNCLTNLKLLENFNYSCFIYFSSFSVFSQNSIKYVKADPINFYGLSKYLSEKIIEKKLTKKKNLIIIRLPVVIGKSKKQNDIIHYIYKKLKKNEDVEIFNNGELKRNIVHYEDVVSIIKQIIDKNPFRKKFNIFHINSSNLLAIKKISEYMKLKMKSRSKIIIKKKRILNSFNSKIINNSQMIKNYKQKSVQKHLDVFLKEFL